MDILSVVLWLLAIYLSFDFVTGVVHFWMDRYGREDMPLLGKTIIEINTWHHENPRRMTRRSYWYLCKSGWAAALIVWTVVYLATGTLSWQLILFGLLGANANQVHKWAHMFPKERPWIINFLQNIRLLQRNVDHAKHHTKPETRAYCTFSPWLNPVLDGIGFWFGIERFFGKLGIYTTDRID